MAVNNNNFFTEAHNNVFFCTQTQSISQYYELIVRHVYFVDVEYAI